MTAHELARKLLEGPDVKVWFENGRWGDVGVQWIKYDDDGATLQFMTSKVIATPTPEDLKKSFSSAGSTLHPGKQ